jgi:hypothetical protein
MLRRKGAASDSLQHKRAAHLKPRPITKAEGDDGRADGVSRTIFPSSFKKLAMIPAISWQRLQSVKQFRHSHSPSCYSRSIKRPSLRAKQFHQQATQDAESIRCPCTYRRRRRSAKQAQVDHWGGRRDSTESRSGSRDATCASFTVGRTPTVTLSHWRKEPRTVKDTED